MTSIDFKPILRGMCSKHSQETNRKRLENDFSLKKDYFLRKPSGNDV
jgi:hypothetical protein